MTIRPSIAQVRFAHPFRLAGHSEEFSAGVYDVLIEDELLHGLSFEAFRRVSTYLQVVGRAGVTELRATTEQDIEAALARDLAKTENTGATAPVSEKDTR
ncbi:hypothetical protein GCM10010991_00480 [Gemmobacter aquaticus]|jgi:hypothetical protein|uniref:Uncharacterized protein n=1 Tax=Gemmobacter aquaticus TaxID=490185 RepID=A0A918DBK2_9RHOB|nr:hypothetical protein [Gemmobacter aquaticus]GGO23283.1 hypothetical protein GCM10010991_00480 [Gemmobacter aquaticus]